MPWYGSLLLWGGDTPPVEKRMAQNNIQIVRAYDNGQSSEIFRPTLPFGHDLTRQFTIHGKVNKFIV